MAVVKVREPFARSGSINAQWQREYERAFTVETDDADDGPVTVGAAIPVKIGDTYRSRNDSDPGSYCQSIRVSCDTEGGKFWTATAQYGPRDILSQEPRDPTERPIKVSWSFSRFERPVVLDQDGKPVLNSAGDPFDPPLTVPDSWPLLTIVRNERTFDSLLAYNFNEAVNLDPFWGVDPGIVKVLDINGELAKDQDIGWYYVVTYQFEFNPDGWQPSVPDLGYRELDASGKPTDITVDGTPVGKPVRLNGKGKYLDKADTTGPTKYLDFRVFKEREFAGLNLDPSMIPRNNE